MLRDILKESAVHPEQSRRSVIRRLQDHFPALCRFAIGGDAVLTWYNAISDPRSEVFLMARTSDAATLFGFMAILGTIIMLDVLLNDATPDYLHVGSMRMRLFWRRAFQYRHLCFASLAFCYAAQPFVAERGGYSVSLLLFFYWNAFLNIAVAFLDAKQRSRGIGWQRACS
ncbi:MAG: hypothetical protein NTX28_07580 [Novosphingobium sp.]|nr:hypothetical protein [Novosphingobium sp.]